MPAAPKMVIMKYQKEAHVNVIARRAVALLRFRVISFRTNVERSKKAGKLLYQSH